MTTPDTATVAFTWTKTGLVEATFNRLARLTSIRHGGDISSTAASVGDSDELVTYMRNTRAKFLSQELVKRTLVIGFSELASMDDTASQIASAALVEQRSKTTVSLARSTGFTKDEKKIFQEVVIEVHQLSQLAAYSPLVRSLTSKDEQS